MLSRDRFHSEVHVLLQSPTSSQTSCSLLLCVLVSMSWWSMVLMHPPKPCYLIAYQDLATQMGIRHLAREHWRRPCEKPAVTSCVNKTSLSSLYNINPKVMNKSKSAFLALVCRGAEDYEMLTGLGIEIRSFALLEANNLPCF